MQLALGYHGGMKKLTPLLVIPLLLAFAVFAVACGDDDDADETPTNVPSVVAPTTSPTAAASATTAPSATNTPAASETAEATTVPPTDGTVFPENAGSTDPFTIKSNPDPSTATYVLEDVRVGAHPESGGWDRIVFEFHDVDGAPGAHPGGQVEYVDDAAECGSGTAVEVQGDAILAVRFDQTQAHDDSGNLTIDDTTVDGPGTSILEAASYCDFEGVVQWAIGVPGEQNFKVSYLEDPSRIVIDVKWP
jgi:hypothetical protein